jgi:hypothetical protein
MEGGMHAAAAPHWHCSMLPQVRAATGFPACPGAVASRHHTTLACRNNTQVASIKRPRRTHAARHAAPLLSVSAKSAFGIAGAWPPLSISGSCCTGGPFLLERRTGTSRGLSAERTPRVMASMPSGGGCAASSPASNCMAERGAARMVETTLRQFGQLTSSTSSTSTVSPGKRCCNGHAQQQQGSDRHQLVGTRARARAHRCHARAVCRNSPPRPQATLANSPDKTRWALRSNAAACAAPGHGKAYGGLSGVQCISD